ncbi:non-specific serine/threonine protein kinase [Salvia divinorum]|uniref:Non-specific serine/threonine protein kinase n=1 Tax=Salvia divinorum TaxID=28513 RepID=A0ABD1HZQ1_SALDI
MNLPLILLLINTLSTLAPIITAQETPLSKNGCQEKCGDVAIPYPFGIGPDCSFNSSYAIECSNQSKPFLKSAGLEATEFSLNDNTVRVMQKVAPLNCSSARGRFQLGQSLLNSPFTYGASINRVTVVGCSTEVSLVGPASSSGGCRPTCGDATDGCFGINCCSIIVPEMSQRVEAAYAVTQGGGGGGSVCGYAFLADFRWLSSEYADYVNFSAPVAEMEAMRLVPATLEWRFDVDEGNLRGVVCENRSVDAHTFDDNEYRFNMSRCRCRQGFQGNPYLSCVDIDECRNSSLSNICGFGSDCVNTDGSFICKNRGRDSHTKSVIIGISSAVGVLIMLGGFWLLSELVKNQIRTNRRRRFFKNNGGLLLEQRLSSAGAAERIKFFDPTELARATDGYDDDRILGRGGQGTVYKGMLRDGRIVAVKKAKRVGEVEEFVNEVVIMSQINHRNVVVLVGCCLETEVPVLVYEFVPNGTLSQHIHVRNRDFPLSWRMRVRIAAEVAGALSYLHHSAASPIYHRDVKSTNILLDGKYHAKVSDFGISRSVGVDQTHLTTRVFGTFGYLDPQYFWSSQFTEKSDVYSFGVVVVEILTGEKAVSIAGVESGRNLAAEFLDSMEGGRLFDILDPEVLEGKGDEVVIMADLARRCLNPRGKERPTMKEVAMELEGIRVREEASVLASYHEESDFQSIDFGEECVLSSDSSTSLIGITPKLSKCKAYQYQPEQWQIQEIELAGSDTTKRIVNGVRRQRQCSGHS